MRKTHLLPAFSIFLVAITACGGNEPCRDAGLPAAANDGSVDGFDSPQDVASNSPQDVDAAVGRPSPVVSAMLRSDGSFVMFRPKANLLAFASTGGDAAAPVQGQWLQISAPILPKVLRLYQGEGSHYPTAYADKQKLASESALTFDELEQACLGFSPEYTSPVALDDAKIATKYWVLEQCAYARFTAKPYWIPQLLLDVDVCGQSLGHGYRTLKESDVRGFLPGEVEAFKKRMDEVNRGGGGFYFSTNVWVRSNAGTMASVQLEDGASAAISPLVFGQPGWTALNHYEGSLALRCIRFAETIE